jgi:hypothetical protein
VVLCSRREKERALSPQKSISHSTRGSPIKLIRKLLLPSSCFLSLLQKCFRNFSTFCVAPRSSSVFTSRPVAKFMPLLQRDFCLTPPQLHKRGFSKLSEPKIDFLPVNYHVAGNGAGAGSFESKKFLMLK